MMRSRGRLFYGIISLCMTAVLLLSSAPVPVLAEEASNDGTVIEVGPAGAAFVSSPCPDQVCVEAGLCDRVGETAVCLPQRVSIRIVGDGGDGAVDAMTG